MYRIKSLSFIFFFPLVIGNAQDVSGQTPKAILWEITSPGKSKPSYVYGTIHIQSSSVFGYDQIVEAKIRETKSFAMELILDEIDQAQMMQSLMMKDRFLSDLLAKEDFEKVNQHMISKTGLSLMTFNGMKPFLVYSQLLQSSMPAEESMPLDMKLLSIARANEKNTHSIESFEDQVGAFNSISLEDQAKMLLGLVTDTIQTDLQFQDLISTYLDQDLDKMMTLTEDPGLPADFAMNFLEKRNEKMANTIAQLISKETTFAAIGAAHLGGEKGVLKLLERKGYTVKPVYFKFKD